MKVTGTLAETVEPFFRLLSDRIGLVVEDIGVESGSKFKGISTAMGVVRLSDSYLDEEDRLKLGREFVRLLFWARDYFDTGSSSPDIPDRIRQAQESLSDNEIREMADRAEIPK